ncbi:MAG TPA: hypothetical protein VKY22_30270 [Bradyrhizobium sp.]|nr:hypothetical protein [Bradyrhizobium sp.]
MSYSQSPPLMKDLDVEGPLLDAHARDLDARSDRRVDMPPGNPPIGSSHSSGRRDGQVTGKRPSIGRRMVRGLVRFAVAVLIGVGITLAWQSYGDVARAMLAAEAPGLAELLPRSTTPSALMAATSPAPAEQLAPLASNIEVVRRSLEQLAARQDQIAQTIAALQAVDEDIRQKMSSTAPVQQPASVLQPKPIMQPRAELPAAPLPAPAPRRPPPATAPAR